MKLYAVRDTDDGKWWNGTYWTRYSAAAYSNREDAMGELRSSNYDGLEVVTLLVVEEAK